MMKLFGIKNIVYSNENGYFTKIKLMNFKSDIVSKGMKELYRL